jgi:lipopolysaccharide/colanic/teichoic acid biosynthesis glycosyltransferase
LKRATDILLSLPILVLLSPVWFLIAIAVSLDSPGGPFYVQERIGRFGRPFAMYKFRTMAKGADRKGLITIGNKDSRITKTGTFLRKYKIDEFPQLLNVIKGDMSLVGPRPEVRKYVEMYNEKQRAVLNVRPGLTDYASLEYFHENELLAQSSDPNKTYVEEVMPAKLALNLRYIEEQSMMTDGRILLRTIRKIIS